jgi:hypothetical protein
MKLFLSCVSSEFKSYRLKLANHLAATKGGSFEVKAIEAAEGAEPVFNLKVMRSESYFVGERGILVHDNSAVRHVLNPFDGVTELELTESSSRS